MLGQLCLYFLHIFVKSARV